MKKLLFLVLTLVVALTLTACNSNNDTNDISQQESSRDTSKQEPGSGRDLVKFPEDYDEGVLFTTVTRGDTYEEVYTSQEAIEAVQDGQPIPSDTVITLKIFKDEELYRYFVMEKRDGWGAQYPSDMRNGEWEYNAFTADGAVAYEEDIGRCFTCHANQERDDYVNKFDEMKNYELKDLTGSKNSSAESRFIGFSTKNWEVKEVGDHPEVIEDKEKEGMIQNVLLTFYFHQGKS
ncbi:cytochrome P460 family protein [Priestia megaterium]